MRSETLQAGSEVYQGSNPYFTYTPEPGLATNKAIENIVAGAASIIANRLTTTSQTTVAGDIDTVIADGIALDPSDWSGILNAVAAQIKNPPASLVLSGTVTTGSSLSLSGTSLTQTEAVDAIFATEKAVIAANPLQSATGVAQYALVTLGTNFNFTSTTIVSNGTSANSSYIIAAIKAAPTTVGGMAYALMSSGEGIASTVPTSPGTAATYSTPIIQDVTAANVAGVAQAVSSFISTATGQGAYASDVVTQLQSDNKNTAALDGDVLGGVIAANQGQAPSIITSSGLWTTVNTTAPLDTDANRISFVSGILAAAPTTSVINDVLSSSTVTGGTILTGTSFLENKTFAGDYLTLVADSAKAVSTSPSDEEALMADLLGNDPVGHAYVISLPSLSNTFGALAIKDSGTTGYAAFQGIIANDPTATSTTAIINYAVSVAKNSDIASTADQSTDVSRAQVAIGLLNEISVASGSDAYAYTQILDNTTSTTDTARATFVGTVADAFLGASDFNTVVDTSFSSSTNSNYFTSVQAAAEDVVKLLPSAYLTSATTVVTAAATGQAGVPSSSGSTSFTNDAAIAQDVISLTTIKNAGLSAAVVQAAAAPVIANDSTPADYVTFANDVVGSTQSTQTQAISQGLAGAIVAGGGNDSSLETFATNFETTLAGDPTSHATLGYEVAGGVAAALTVPSDSAGLSIDVTIAESGSTASAAIRGKIAAAVAFAQTSQASTLVADMLSGDGSLTLLTALTDKDTVAEDVTASVPASAGGDAQDVAATLGGDATGYKDIGASDGDITKVIPTTLPAATRLTYISSIVSLTMSDTTDDVNTTIINSGTGNIATFLEAGAGAATTKSGDLFADAVAGDMVSGYGFSSSTDSASMDAFVAAMASKAATSMIYIAQGFAEFIPATADVAFSGSAATLTGTASALVTAKGYIAEGVATADTTQAPLVATTVAATVPTVINPNTTALDKLADTDNADRTTIAVDVAKAVPADAPDIVYNVGLQYVDVSGTDNSLALLAKGVAGAVDTVLPKANLAEQMGSIASEAILAGSTLSTPLIAQGYAEIAADVAGVKAGTAYEVIGASIATIAELGVNVTTFEGDVTTLMDAATAAVQSEVSDAIAAYNGNANSFDVGPVTRPETGITNS